LTPFHQYFWLIPNVFDMSMPVVPTSNLSRTSMAKSFNIVWLYICPVVYMYNQERIQENIRGLD